MKIEEAYLHVLDANANIKLLSERPMALDVDVEEYAIKHVEGFFEHLDIVETALMQTTKIDYRNDDFKLLTIEIADLFFDAMQKSEDIKACDLMCLKFEREDEHFVGFLKLNFRTSFAHAATVEDNLITNKIIRQVTTLPYKSQKVEEGFLLNLTREKALIKDKWIHIDGQKSHYISENVLGVKPEMTAKKKIDIVAKTAQKIMEKYDDQPMMKTAKVKEMMTAQLDENGTLDIDEIAKSCFDTTVARDAYMSELEEKGVEGQSIQLNEAQSKKLKRTQKIKTASGVEIILPYEYISRSENLSIETQPDGSISIELKNLGELL